MRKWWRPEVWKRVERGRRGLDRHINVTCPDIVYAYSGDIPKIILLMNVES
jgi:hypothetical protein